MVEQEDVSAMSQWELRVICFIGVRDKGVKENENNVDIKEDLDEGSPV